MSRPVASADSAWISWLRVAAILGVVLIHVGGISAQPFGGPHTSAGAWGVVLDFASRWSVPVFVMVSGALLLEPARYRGAGDFWRRRALRLVPAVIVWNLVYLVYVELHAGPVGPGEVVRRILTGHLYTALYFFWIVLGLAALTPLIMPAWAAAGERARLLVGLGALALPILTLVTVPLRTGGGVGAWHADVAWVETPWTWWIPWLGYYLLGHALRDVVLTGWRAALAGVVALGGTLLLIWQWGRLDGLGGGLQRYVPAEAYYGPVVAVVAISVFLLAHSLIRPGGRLAVLCGRGAAVAGRRLGDATLGVYGVHLLIRAGVLALPGLGGADLASSPAQLVARAVVVFVLAYLVALLAARVPYLRRVF